MLFLFPVMLVKFNRLLELFVKTANPGDLEDFAHNVRTIGADLSIDYPITDDQQRALLCRLCQDIDPERMALSTAFMGKDRVSNEALEVFIAKPDLARPDEVISYINANEKILQDPDRCAIWRNIRHHDFPETAVSLEYTRFDEELGNPINLRLLIARVTTIDDKVSYKLLVSYYPDLWTKEPIVLAEGAEDAKLIEKLYQLAKLHLTTQQITGLD